MTDRKTLYSQIADAFDALAALEDSAQPTPTPVPPPTPTPTPTALPTPDFGGATATVASLNVPLGFSGDVLVPVTLDRPSSARQAFHLNTVNGSVTPYAYAGGQFVAHNEWIIFDPGETQKAFPVHLNGSSVDGMSFSIGNQEQVGYGGSKVIGGTIKWTASGVAPVAPKVDNIAFNLAAPGALIYVADFSPANFKAVAGGSKTAFDYTLPAGKHEQPGNGEPVDYANPVDNPGIKAFYVDALGLHLCVTKPAGGIKGLDSGKVWPYSAAVISTHGGLFSATYYDAICDITAPTALGTWIGWWAMPVSGAWPPENDIIEAIVTTAGQPGNAFITQHPPQGGSYSFTCQPSYWKQLGIDTTKLTHTWRQIRRADYTTTLVDGIVVNRQRTVGDVPMYMLWDITMHSSAANGQADVSKGNEMIVNNVKVFA